MGTLLETDVVRGHPAPRSIPWRVGWFEPEKCPRSGYRGTVPTGKEETVGNKDKGATKASKKVAQKSLKEKRQSKKSKRAASTGRAE